MVAQVGDEVTDFKVEIVLLSNQVNLAVNVNIVNLDNIIYVHIWNLWRHHHTMVRSVNT